MLATEARLTCNLEHPNIVQVYELGEVDGRYYIAMEYVNGIDLRQLWRSLARRGLRLPIQLAVFIASEFLKGLDFAHNAIGPDGKRLGVVHRDVSPSNILVSLRGDVKIGDFGIALVQQESKSRNSTVKGKFGYMTPEQLSNLEVDHRSDLFSAGVVLAELATGRRIFKGQSDFETMRRVLNGDLHVLDECEASLPAELTDILRRALDRDVSARYQSAAAFQEDLAGYLYRTTPRINNRSLAVFLIGHVIPYIQGGEDPGGTASTEQTLEPESIPSATPPDDRVEATPSQEIDELYDDDAATTPGAPLAFYGDTDGEVTATATGQVVDWTRLAPEGELLDGTADESPQRDGGGLVGFVQQQLVRPGGPPASDGDDDHGVHHYGEQTFDFSDSTEQELEIDEAASGRSGTYVALMDDPSPDLNALQVSRHLAEVTAEAIPPADFRGALGKHTLARVLFRFMVAKEDGLLVLTGPGLAGPQKEIHDWLTRVQLQARAASDSHPTSRRTCHVHLLSGQPDLISADRSEEDIAAHLVRVGLVSRAKLSKAVRANPTLKPVTALVATGNIVPLQLARQLASFVQWSVLDAFGWITGSYAFFRGRVCDDGFPTTYRGYEIVAKGASSLTGEALDSHFARIRGKLAIKRSPVSAEEIFPAPPVPQILRALAEQPLAPAEVLAQVKADPLHIKQALYVLTECELVEPG